MHSRSASIFLFSVVVTKSFGLQQGGGNSNDENVLISDFKMLAGMQMNVQLKPISKSTIKI